MATTNELSFEELDPGDRSTKKVRTLNDTSNDSYMEDFSNSPQVTKEDPVNKVSYLNKLLGNKERKKAVRFNTDKPLNTDKVKVMSPTKTQPYNKFVLVDDYLWSIQKTWKENTIILKLEGSYINYNILSAKICSLWNLTGDDELMDLSYGCYILKLENLDRMEYILIEGPWIMEMPVEYYQEEILFAIASSLRSLVKIDPNTYWNLRGKFGRMCVQLDLKKQLQGIIDINGKLYKLTYENLPAICFNCGRVGHRKENCPAKVVCPEKATAEMKTSAEAETSRDMEKDYIGDTTQESEGTLEKGTELDDSLNGTGGASIFGQNSDKQQNIQRSYQPNNNPKKRNFGTRGQKSEAGKKTDHRRRSERTTELFKNPTFMVRAPQEKTSDVEARGPRIKSNVIILGTIQTLNTSTATEEHQKSLLTANISKPQHESGMRERPIFHAKISFSHSSVPEVQMGEHNKDESPILASGCNGELQLCSGPIGQNLRAGTESQLEREEQTDGDIEFLVVADPGCNEGSRRRDRRRISMELGIGCSENLGNYLGVPLVHDRVSPRLFRELIDKVQARLSSWKAKLLNFAAHMTLLKLVMAALPVHTMQSTWLSQGTCNQLDRLNRAFL
ncbi:hypothetical protein BUALT_Bualt13G0049500 [Buddleja alternifolia]|uniref:CCHC-type domain-containing protein n=1 Tax=Buddleja alternifolia TaxID=168488 RepID=A0AAV6WVS4_9LAMI|nr:hypothetical protein BUALT_Bualt13G0049500 [Buddleja alternifolia]